MKSKVSLRKKSKRFRDAEDNLKRIQKRIAPFAKPKRAKRFSTTGKWHETSVWFELQSKEKTKAKD